MHAHRTALARFIDLSALWSLCLTIWFYVLLARLRQLYPALILACVCAAATIGLVALLRRALMPRRRAALHPDMVRHLCAHVALSPPRAALDDLAAWLRFCGKYPDCARVGDTLTAHSADGVSHVLALAQVWPEAHAGPAELIDAWRRCHGDVRRGDPDAPRVSVISTADFTPQALALARELGISAIAPRTLAALMRSALPICGDARRHKVHLRLRSLISRAHAGRFGAYALGLGISGRLLGLAYFRAAGLCCALMWLLCAAQPRPRHGDAWP